MTAPATTVPEGAGRAAATPSTVGSRVAAWLTPALPRNRLAVLRVIAYAFAVLYVFWLNLLPVHHAELPAERAIADQIRTFKSIRLPAARGSR